LAPLSRGELSTPARFDVLPTEAAAPERRVFVLALGLTNIAFLSIDLATAWPGRGVLLAGRVALTVVLLATPALIARAAAPRRARAVAGAAGALAAICFGAVAYGSGGLRGPYLGLMPLLPMIYLIGIPDAPIAVLVTGLISAALGLSLAVQGGARGSALALWLAAFASGTGYATTGAALHLRARRRDAQAQRELARGEQRRKQAERLALVGRLAAGLAHEVNNPLAVVSANVSFLSGALGRAGLGADPDLRDALAETRASVDRLRRIVIDVSALARETPEERASFDLAPVLAEAAQLASVRGIPVALAVPEGLPPVLARRHRLVEIVAGVLVSAAEADGRADAPGQAPLRVSAWAERDRVAVAIGDLRPGTRLPLDDLLVVLARERLAECGGVLDADAPRGGPGRLVLRVPADRGHARSTRALTPPPAHRA